MLERDGAANVKGGVVGAGELVDEERLGGEEREERDGQRRE